MESYTSHFIYKQVALAMLSCALLGLGANEHWDIYFLCHMLAFILFANIKKSVRDMGDDPQPQDPKIGKRPPNTSQNDPEPPKTVTQSEDPKSYSGSRFTLKSNGSIRVKGPDMANSRDKMQSFINLLTTVAQKAYTTRKSRFLIAADYSRVQSKVAKFFKDAEGFDFVADCTYGMCLEIKTLTQVIEVNVRPSSDHRYKPVAWPVAKLSVEEAQASKKAASKKVDRMIWGVKKTVVKKAEVEAEKEGSVKSDSGYSSISVGSK